MNTVQRRSVLKALSGLPILGGVAKWYLFGDPSPNPNSPEAAERMRGLGLIRLVSTAQSKYFLKHRHYGDMSDLVEGGFVAEVSKLISPEKIGFGGSTAATLRFDREQVAPGWNLSPRLNPDRSSYAFLITSSARGVNSFSSDEGGIIYEGSPRPSSPVAWLRASQLIDGAPIGTPPKERQVSRFGSIIRGLALGPETVHADPNGCNNCCVSSWCFCSPISNQNTIYCGCPNCQYCSVDPQYCTGYGC
jgi:hypothetical protein